jgi:Arc/MetJ-type ribon-helix-helix transcriptional regulator
MASKSDDILSMINEELKKEGIDLKKLGEDCLSGLPLKMVFVASDLDDSLREMGEETRDQVVMVRIDDETTESLDDWVETGAVKSRSEGAALFIREGLKVRADELARLKDALADVKAAKEKLREQARDVLGGQA